MDSVLSIIGGTGLYSIPGLVDAERISIDTPYGKPSSDIVRGRIGDLKVQFLARHGEQHSLLPSEINYRANVHALKELSVEFSKQWCISISAVGSLREEIHPGDIVIPDQAIDRTEGRARTFFGNGAVIHVAFGSPFCPALRTLCAEAAQVAAASVQVKPPTVHTHGTYVCIEGPTFSTRAESEMYRSFRATVVGMTNLPEARLFREAEIAYASINMVTDYDCWKSNGQDTSEEVDVTKILETLARNSEVAKRIVSEVARLIPGKSPSDLARNALAAAFVTRPENIPPEAQRRLYPIIAKYLG